MAFNFPSPANVGDIYSSGGTTFQFDGVAWNYVNTTAVLAYNQANAAYTRANSAAQITFGTVIANGSSIVAASNNDTLTIIANANVSIVANTSTKNITFDLTDTGVTYTTYGNSTIVPIFTVDNKGRLRSAANATIDTTIATAAFAKANAQANLAFKTVIANGTSLLAASNGDILTIRTTGNVAITADAAGDNMTFDLTTTGVTATTYGSSTILPVFTVDARGRLTSVTNTTIDTTIATAAFARANAANLIANLAFDRANIANVTACAAFAAANTMVMKAGNTMTGNLVFSAANITFISSAVAFSNLGIYFSNTPTVGIESAIYANGSNTLVFATRKIERIRIDASGNVGIGNTVPVASLDVSGSFSVAKANVLSQTLTYGANATTSWDTSLGQVATVTLTGTTTTLSNATNIKVGTYILHVIQDSTGGRLLTFGSGYKFTGAVAPVLTTSANARDMFSFVSDGTNLYGAMIPDVR